MLASAEHAQFRRGYTWQRLSRLVGLYQTHDLPIPPRTSLSASACTAYSRTRPLGTLVYRPQTIPITCQPSGSYSGRHASNLLTRFDVARHDCTCPDQGPLSDANAAEDDGARADRRAALDDGLQQLPVSRTGAAARLPSLADACR